MDIPEHTCSFPASMRRQLSLQLQQATVAGHPFQRLPEHCLGITGLTGAVQGHHKKKPKGSASQYQHPALPEANSSRLKSRRQNDFRTCFSWRIIDVST